MATKWTPSTMGKKGGAAKSPKKTRAAIDNIKKARQSRWLKQTA